MAIASNYASPTKRKGLRNSEHYGRAKWKSHWDIDGPAIEAAIQRSLVRAYCNSLSNRLFWKD
jgi:hypothetical protein